MFVEIKEFVSEFYDKNNREPWVAVDGSQWACQVSKLKYMHDNDSTRIVQLNRKLKERLLVFLELAVRIVVVFDGPGRPIVKRGKTRTSNFDPESVNCLKSICHQFSVPIVNAEGEAEAECARLQVEGKVDYVFSNDADVLLFGATKIVMYKSGENGTLGTGMDRLLTIISLPPEEERGFGRIEYIFGALLQGGDYDTGSKLISRLTAREASHKRTGFARQLLVDIYGFSIVLGQSNFRLNASQQVLDDWTDHFRHELSTNESKFFSRKHPKAASEFVIPDYNIIEYYIHPVLLEKVEIDKSFQLPSAKLLFEKGKIAYKWGRKTLSRFIEKYKEVLPTTSEDTKQVDGLVDFQKIKEYFAWCEFLDDVLMMYLIHKLKQGNESPDWFEVHGIVRHRNGSQSIGVTINDFESIVGMQGPSMPSGYLADLDNEDVGDSRFFKGPNPNRTIQSSILNQSKNCDYLGQFLEREADRVREANRPKNNLLITDIFVTQNADDPKVKPLGIEDIQVETKKPSSRQQVKANELREKLEKTNSKLDFFFTKKKPVANIKKPNESVEKPARKPDSDHNGTETSPSKKRNAQRDPEPRSPLGSGRTRDPICLSSDDDDELFKSASGESDGQLSVRLKNKGNLVS